MPPPVPVIVSVTFARFAREALIVSVDVPDPVTEVGLKVAVVRFGSPVTLRLTADANPFTAPIVTV